MQFAPLTRLSLVRRATFTTSTSKIPLLISPAEYKNLPKVGLRLLHSASLMPCSSNSLESLLKKGVDDGTLALQSTTVPLDVSWHMPNSRRSALAEYLTGPRIPGARRFDLDEVAELDLEKNPLSLTHMLPSAEKFREACLDGLEKLGLTHETHVVVYDSLGVFSSPRGVYTFKAFGHEKVSALDGGLPRWVAEGGEVEMGAMAEIGESDYDGSKGLDPEFVRSYEQIVENSEKSPENPEFELVLDHRSLARYNGEAPEPRAGLSSGHIPNSLPAPFSNYLSPASDSKPYTSFRSSPELKEVIVDAVGGKSEWDKAANGDRGLVFTCGSGMSAAVGWLANEVVRAEEGGKTKSAIYDESWTGYASRGESKIEKGGKDANHTHAGTH